MPPSARPLVPFRGFISACPLLLLHRLRMPVLPPLPGQCAPGLFGQSKIDLPLERVHFGHLHLDLIAQLDHTAAAAANQLIAIGLKNKKIVLD